MRTFGQSAVECFEFRLEGSDTVYRIPLAQDLPLDILDDMIETSDTDRAFHSQVNFLKKYMGDDVGRITVSMLHDIFAAWGEASRKAGASLGES